jgi:hypothetical protein
LFQLLGLNNCIGEILDIWKIIILLITWGQTTCQKCSNFSLFELSLKLPNVMCFFSPLVPYLNFKACYLQSEKNSLNQDWDSIPQYLMLKIQNNYGNGRHSNSKGTQEKIKMMKLKYTKFCDNLNFIPPLNAMCFFTSQISLLSSRLFNL